MNDKMPKDITENMTDFEVARKVYEKYGSSDGDLKGLSHSLSRWLGWSLERSLKALESVRQESH